VIPELAAAPADLVGDAVAASPLSGGTNHRVWLVTRADGARLVVKTTPGLPPDAFPAEADGLRALAGSGLIGAPAVLGAGPGYLVMAALRPAPPLTDAPFWERTGRDLARLHARPGERFGWHRDNWLGLVRQVNPWTDDCYEFFARHRLLRYLPEPAARALLAPDERAAVERIAARLPDLVPPARPALTHGDLWHGNVLTGPDGGPALIDPAVSWSWPEVDLSMLLAAGAPATLFSAYHEIRPPDRDWRDHLALLHLRELLSVIAHGDLLADAVGGAVAAVRELIKRYA
jgi:fructosamine-3-kinase